MPFRIGSKHGGPGNKRTPGPSENAMAVSSRKSVAAPALIVVAAKVPIAGRVKTRLVDPSVPGLTPDTAARLAQAFLADTLATAADPALRATDRWLALDGEPDDLPPGLLAAPFSLRAQTGNSLGERLVNLTEAGFAAGYGRVCVVGSDAPHLPLAFLLEAFGRLAPTPSSPPENGADVVLGPADDGGYYLIALRKPAPDLFTNIPWSGPDVFSVTRARASASGLTVARLPAWYDVDVLADLRRLRSDLARGVARAPATHELLSTLTPTLP